MKRVLAATPRTEAVDAIRKSLQGWKVDLATNREDALVAAGVAVHDYLFIDIDILCPDHGRADAEDMADLDVFAAGIKPFRMRNPAASIVALSSDRRVRAVVQAVKAGASNYLNYPLDQTEVEYVIRSLYRAQIESGELDYLRDKFWRKDAAEIVRSRSPLMREVFEKVRLVAPTRSTVLLTGESGVGKSLFAKMIHSHSNRSNAQFIAVHCGAIPDSLIESDLFGHEKGAFTGAVRKKLGKFEIASGGAIFLDEVGTLTPSAQIKLLQVLQERTFQRVGGESTLKTDVRVIAATNADIAAMCDSGEFRKDLYYRLSVFPLRVPSLRERLEDIPLLAASFLERLDKEYLKGVTTVSPEALEALQRYDWPGNVRELENLIERAYILERGDMLTPEGFPAELFDAMAHPYATCPTAVESGTIDQSSFLPLTESRRRAVDEFERKYLHRLLQHARGSIKETAARAGVSTRQLHKLMTRHGLNKDSYK